MIPSKIDGTDVKFIRFTSASSCKSLTSITIPESITSINEFDFIDCINLTSVKIANSVTSIGRDAFKFCTKTKFYVASETMKQLLINSGVTESQIVVGA